ncbi:SUKH-4 family immunity protein [Kitasatospora sp. NPDC007106]|uniref:SUKH-4 family immunity protein n=1 Tax=Kitasatospora sp. NPDC007106 TaxID=3156914 RepID=UPI0033C358FF
MTNDESPATVSVAVDCAGHSLESVIVAAARAAAEAGPDAKVRLERVEDAGPLVSSDEPARIRSCGSREISRLVGRPVTLAPPLGGTRPAVERHELPVDQEELLWLAAASALELPRSGVETWRTFAAALVERPVTVEQLEGFAASRPELVVEGRTVGFVEREAHRDIRARLPLSGMQQRAIHRALLNLRSDEPAYMGAARPVHAALAGELGEWLTDPDFLVESGWYGLGLGLALAYSEGVPLGTVAGDLHCLLLEGVAAPASHEEWLSWVHHTLVGRGFTAAADEVATRVRLPWQTLWSHWRWPSGYAPRTPAETEQDRILLVHGPDGPTLATRHEPWDGDGTVYEQLRDARTGEPLGGPSTEPHTGILPQEQALAGIVVGHVNGEWALRRWRDLSVPALPWMGESVTFAALCEPPDPAAGALWVFMGRCGLFGAVVHEDLMARLPRFPRGEHGSPLSGRARWPRPEVSFDGPLGREELEQDRAFGRGACHPVTPERLPAAVEHGATREFLGEVGWPAADHPGLLTSELAPGGLVPADGRPGLLAGLGRFFGSPILLDGRTGEVFGEDWNRELVLIASGLPQFLRIVMLHRAVLQVPVLLGVDDSLNLEEDVLSWIRTIDPAAAEAGFWEQKYFAPTLLDLWQEAPE